jgi:hypothetical protein
MIDETDNSSSDPVAGVDWSTIADDVECARCGYNLRGLDRPRCPECGLKFSWEEILNPELRPHPYLYEHHGGHNRFRRLIKTVAHSWIPWRFWRTMRMNHPRRPVRLAAFGFWLALIGTMISSVGTGLITTGAYYVYSTPILGPGDPSFTKAATFGKDQMYRTLNRCFGVAATYLVLCVLNVACMSFLFRSLRRYRVLPGHLWRVAVYTGGGNWVLFVALWGLLFPNFGIVRQLFQVNILLAPMELVAQLGALCLVAHWFGSMTVAGYFYLRVKGWWVVAISTQIIAVLVLLNVLVLANL